MSYKKIFYINVLMLLFFIVNTAVIRLFDLPVKFETIDFFVKLIPVSVLLFLVVVIKTFKDSKVIILFLFSVYFFAWYSLVKHQAPFLLGYAVGQVTSSSMEPTLEITDSVVYKTGGINVERNDIVIALGIPSQDGGGVINVNKRVAAVPGDEVFTCDFEVYINNVSFYKDHKDKVDCLHVENINLKGEEYYLLGDNKFSSYDSRFFGVVNKKDISAVALYKVSKSSNVIYFQ